VKVLVASTENIVRHIATKTLTPAGFSVTCVASGEEAWQHIDHETGPLIAVLDWQMPAYDGLTICRTLRSSNFRDYVYVLLLTSRKNKMDELVALESGIDDYLQKPFLADELLARVNIGKRVVAHERKLSAIISEYRAMVDLSPFPMVSLDAKGIIRRTNLPFVNLAGTQPPAEFLGLAIGDVLSLNVHELNFLVRQIQEKNRIDAMPWHPVWKNAAAFNEAIAAEAKQAAALKSTIGQQIKADQQAMQSPAPTPLRITGPTHIYGRSVTGNNNISYILTLTNGLVPSLVQKKSPEAARSLNEADHESAA
jgi:DNA-binding response OmpR family regulator